MSKKIPTDYTPYVPAWEQLADAIRRIAPGPHQKELAQADLCRAICDRTVNIRCKLEKHTTRHFTSKHVLYGKDFQLPTEIKPADLEWGLSRPLKPWIVRRECYSPPGLWDLALIEVCRADVSKAFCVATEQDENTQHAASRPALDGQEMPIRSGRRSLLRVRRPNVAGPGRRRGARPHKFEQTKEAMRNDIQTGKVTVAELENMLEKQLAVRYGVSRDTARKARKAVLSELNSRQIPTNDN